MESSANAAAQSAEDRKEKKKSKARKDSSEAEEEQAKKDKPAKKSTKVKKTKEEVAQPEPAQAPATTTGGLIDIDDLLGMGDSKPQAPVQQTTTSSMGMGSLLDDFGMSQPV